jgi:hypothetical protein
MIMTMMMMMMIIIIIHSKNNNKKHNANLVPAPQAYTPPVAVQANVCSVPHAICVTIHDDEEDDDDDNADVDC